MPNVAKLPSETVQKIEKVEKDLGVVLVAYEKMPKFSTLKGADLDKIQALEKQLGVKLVAIE